ncbi:hypothetical protein [Paenibacillus donghaensis]|uniref:Uncharacterized protein n=1 Tax=Paenibacillus donghaensis TaxID=414771 RepID=A0A2Z2KHN8_9BACL|nr:hypothetical protein [Paenibacillus donghaensis]ASA22783.1 hypothetical protein B9T62_19440 [Paenibacillus donghaensis]
MATQEIGIPIDLSQGTFNNTVFQDGKLQLRELGKDDLGTSIYAPEGYWISESIRIADKVALFKYIAKTMSGTGTYKIFTQSSNDGFVWTDWIEINTDGSINTPVGYYAKIKIFIIPSSTLVSISIDQFTTPDKYTNPFINASSGVLELKKTYTSPYAIDNAWTDGVLIKALVQKSQFKKIDKLK